MIRARREYKYLIGGVQEERVREWVGERLAMDRASRGAPGGRYGVYSLYLDSGALHTYWATNMGHRDRFKLRLRWYNQACQGPAFCEVKSRCADSMTKYRSRVLGEHLLNLVEGGFPERTWLEAPSPQDLEHALVFANRCAELGAIPAVGVGYDREAYISDASESLRITFDRNLEFHAPWSLGADPDPEKWRPMGLRQTLLEVKFRRTVPRWVHTMTGALDLTRTSFSKYGHGIEFLGLDAGRFLPAEGTYDGI